MRRVLLSVVLGVLICWWTPTAHGEVPTGDSVVGQGLTGPNPDGSIRSIGFDIDARSGPSGEAPTGHVALEVAAFFYPPAVIQGPVRCVSVSGNGALVGFESPTNPGVIVQLEDNGPPGSHPPDTLGFALVDDPTSCALPPVTLFPFEVVEGDLTVSDAPALPTGKSQCKNGGWRNYPQFKNEGQCVAFVNHGS
jgi:hypothetical protein